MNGINASSLIRFGSISFSDKEIIDIIRAWLAISFAFAMILSDGFSGLFPAFILASLTVGIGFIAHEMGHKIAAQHYGAWAEFRAWNLGLLLAVALSFLGFIIAAPGAVIIQGRTIGKSSTLSFRHACKHRKLRFHDKHMAWIVQHDTVIHT